MTARKWTVLIAFTALAGFGWYWFRPELLFIDDYVHESFPEEAASLGDASVLARGSFRGIAHETRGTATILALGDGRKMLRFTDFATSNGPDVRVYLVAAEDAPDSESVLAAEHFELGLLKGNIGDQNYAIPPDADLSRFRSVVIWCKRFSVNFATASLTTGG